MAWAFSVCRMADFTAPFLRDDLITTMRRRVTKQKTPLTGGQRGLLPRYSDFA
jgi:hypothetical protein